MRKYLSFLLCLLIGANAFAQNQVLKAVPDTTNQNFKVAEFQVHPKVSQTKSIGEAYLENEAFYTTYDLQSNGFVTNRMYQNKNGDVAVVAMQSADESGSAADRGTGYNFYKDGKILEGGYQFQKIEANATGADMRTGWPSIAPYGAEGEIMVCHTGNGLVYYTRTKAGEGVWDGPYDIPNLQGGINGVTTELILSWPKIVTTGANNETVHIFAAATTDYGTAQLYLRSSDLQNWYNNWAPCSMDNLHVGIYDADDYAVAVNENHIAVVYNNWMKAHTMLYKSSDNGNSWESKIIWENPIHLLDWETDEGTIFEQFNAPTHVSIALDKYGDAHVALSVGMFTHSNLGTSYGLYHGLQTDGVAYWYEGYGMPLQSPDGNPWNALKLWWEDENNPGYININPQNFCAWMPPHETSGFGEFESSKQYTGSGSSAGDYLSSFGLSAYPSIAVDPAGNIAVAFSAPDLNRDCRYGQFYYRSIFVNYKPAGLDWTEMTVLGQSLYEDFIHSCDECTYVTAVSNPVNENEFWFSCLSDDTPGFHYGNSASQDHITTSTVNVFKFCPNGIDDDNPVNPNPEPESEPEQPSKYWNPDESLYANNMTIISTVEIEGVEASSSDIEIGAFCNGELRGSERLQYVGSPAIRYECFLMIYGNSGDIITFKVYDHATASVLNLKTSTVVTFEANGTIGDIVQPTTMNFTSGEIIAATANPAEGGTIEGAGSYQTGENVTLKATENEGYIFLNWTENGEIVSNEYEYTFVVESARNLVANFGTYQWIPDVNIYPNNMTVTTSITIDNILQENTRLEIGAFCNDELRGSGRLEYIPEPINKYEAFVMIYGNDGDKISFKIYDHITAKILDLEADDTLAFKVNETIGSVVEPHNISFITKTDNPDEPDEPKLDAPQNVKANAISTSSIIVTWDVVENATSYNVYRNDELVENVRGTSYMDEELEYNTEYCYSIKAINDDVMSDYSEEVCVKTLGEGVEELTSAVNIYPNPANDKLYIEAETEIEEVVVYDVYGKSQKLKTSETQNLKTSVDVSGLNSGVYLIKINTESGNITKRFVKE